MSTRKEVSTATKILRPLGLGLGIGVIVCAVILLIAAAIMTTGIFPASAVTPVALATAAVASFVSGIVAARVSRERGLLYGAGVGLLLFLLITVVGMVTSQELRGTMMLLKAALTIGFGALGGVLGVNVKAKR